MIVGISIGPPAGGFVVRATAIRGARIRREMAITAGGRLALGARPKCRRLCRVRSTSFLVCHRVAGVCARTPVVIVVPCLVVVVVVVSSRRSTPIYVRGGEKKGSAVQYRTTVVGNPRSRISCVIAGATTRGNEGITEKRRNGQRRRTHVEVRSPMYVCVARGVLMCLCAHACACARARLSVRKQDSQWRINGEEWKRGGGGGGEEGEKKVGSVSRAPSSSARKVPGSRLLHARVSAATDRQIDKEEKVTAGGRGSPRHIRKGRKGESESERGEARIRSGGENGCVKKRRGDPSAGARVSRDGERRAEGKRERGERTASRTEECEERPSGTV